MRNISNHFLIWVMLSANSGIPDTMFSLYCGFFKVVNLLTWHLKRYYASCGFMLHIQSQRMYVLCMLQLYIITELDHNNIVRDPKLEVDPF